MRWKKREISGQSLKAGSRDDLIHIISKLLEKREMWQEIHHQGGEKNRRAKKNVTPVCHHDEEVTSLRTEVTVLKCKNTELELKVAALKQKKIPSKEHQKADLKDSWIGVQNSSKCLLGKVLEVGYEWLKTHFLTGRMKGKPYKRDIQQVDVKYVIAGAQHLEEKDGFFFMSKDVSQSLAMYA